MRQLTLFACVACATLAFAVPASADPSRISESAGFEFDLDADLLRALWNGGWDPPAPWLEVGLATGAAGIGDESGGFTDVELDAFAMVGDAPGAFAAAHVDLELPLRFGDAYADLVEIPRGIERVFARAALNLAGSRDGFSLELYGRTSHGGSAPGHLRDPRIGPGDHLHTRLEATFAPHIELFGGPARLRLPFAYVYEGVELLDDAQATRSDGWQAHGAKAALHIEFPPQRSNDAPTGHAVLAQMEYQQTELAQGSDGPLPFGRQTFERIDIEALGAFWSFTPEDDLSIGFDFVLIGLSNVFTETREPDPTYAARMGVTFESPQGDAATVTVRRTASFTADGTRLIGDTRLVLGMSMSPETLDDTLGFGVEIALGWLDDFYRSDPLLTRFHMATRAELYYPIEEVLQVGLGLDLQRNHAIEAAEWDPWRAPGRFTWEGGAFARLYVTD